MPNMSKTPLTPEQKRFIQDMAALLVPWGMQPSLASLYAYLLLCDEPVSLDTIIADLGMAKSSASVAARVLEHYGLARRHAERGSKRVRYGASESYSGFIVAQATLMGDLGRLIETRARTVAAHGTLSRLRYLGSFYRKMEATITGRVRELAEEFIQFGPDEDLR
jgi:DNA-binding transcriptional regulator GbsR (MarR family)